VSVVVPLYNCLALTQAMLASLEASWPRDLPCEVVLVDDGSTDGTRDWLQGLRAPYRVVLNDRNLGYAAANNRGVALATGERLLLLNNDLLFRRGWLEPMLAAHRHLGDRAGLIGNVQRTIAGNAIDHTGILVNAKGKPEHDRTLPWRAALPHPWSIREVPAVTGACLLVTRSLYLAHGGFSEAYQNGCEDVDLAFRLEAQGRVNAVALRSVVGHHVSASPGRKRLDELNTYRLTRRWSDTLARHATRAWCRWHLERDWTSPTASPDAGEAAAELAYALRLRRVPPTSAVVGTQRAIAKELDRWRAMFPDEGATPG
jgi:O-antigen biosynthesis protein